MMTTTMTMTPQFHNDDDSLTSMKVKAVATVEKEKEEIILVPITGGEDDEDEDDVERLEEQEGKPVTTTPHADLKPKHRSLSTSSLSTLAASFKNVLTHTPHNRKSASSSSSRHLWNSGKVVSIGSSGSRKSRISILDTTSTGSSSNTLQRSLSNPNLVSSDGSGGGGGKHGKFYYFDGNGNIYWKEW